MRTTTYKCDRCGAESVDKNTLHKVKAGYGDYTSDVNGRQAEWCKKCCVETGLAHQNLAPEVKPLDPLPTLEDMIREIVREEIQNS